MHAFKKGTDAAPGCIRNGPVVGDGEGEFFVLGADAELVFRLAARFEPGNKFVASLDWSHVDLVTGHAKFRRREDGDAKHAALQRAMRLTLDTWRNSAASAYGNIFSPLHCQAGSYSVLFRRPRPALLILSMTQFTPHQEKALDAVGNWLRAKPGTNGTPQVFRLFGYAGTGKTTLARHIADAADGEVKFAAFTGKAASVMRGKGCRGASTIHGLIYRARESGEEIPSFDLWDEAPASKAELIIIDECSMVDAELGRDLLSFGVPVLVLGDPAQLPPIQGG